MYILHQLGLGVCVGADWTVVRAVLAHLGVTSATFGFEGPCLTFFGVKSLFMTIT